MEQMLCMLEELQITKRSGDQKLQETEHEAMFLSRKVEAMERTIKEMCPTLVSHDKLCGHNSVTSPDAAAGPRQLPPDDFSARAVEDLNKTTKPQGRLILVSNRSHLWKYFSVQFRLPQVFFTL